MEAADQQASPKKLGVVFFACLGFFSALLGAWLHFVFGGPIGFVAFAAMLGMIVLGKLYLLFTQTPTKSDTPIGWYLMKGYLLSVTAIAVMVHTFVWKNDLLYILLNVFAFLPVCCLRPSLLDISISTNSTQSWVLIIYFIGMMLAHYWVLMDF